MRTYSSFLQSIYTKIVFACVLAAAGVALGIYVGFAAVKRAPVTGAPELTKSAGAPHMNLHPGDLFPWESYSTVSGQKSSFEALLQDRNTILMFVSLDCSPCLDLLKYASQQMKVRLNPGVQVIACLNASDPDIPSEYRGLFKGITIIYIDDRRWRTEYQLAVWPTIVGVDRSGFVRHIQIGYDDAVDHELVEYFFRSNQ
jgi:hypothetical protein